MIPASATKERATAPAVTPPTVSRSHSTSPIPTRPSANPSHWSRVTRSPSRAPTMQAVTTGCRPTISAETPAGSPSATDQNTPPR